MPLNLKNPFQKEAESIKHTNTKIKEYRQEIKNIENTEAKERHDQLVKRQSLNNLKRKIRNLKQFEKNASDKITKANGELQKLNEVVKEIQKSVKSIDDNIAILEEDKKKLNKYIENAKDLIIKEREKAKDAEERKAKAIHAKMVAKKAAKQKKEDAIREQIRKRIENGAPDRSKNKKNTTQ